MGRGWRQGGAPVCGKSCQVASGLASPPQHGVQQLPRRLARASTGGGVGWGDGGGGDEERRSCSEPAASVFPPEMWAPPGLGLLHPLPATGDACLFYQGQAVTLTTVSPYQQPTSCPWGGSGSGRPVRPHAPRLPVPRARPGHPQVSLCWECGGGGPSLPPPSLPFCEGSPQRCPLGQAFHPLLRQGQQCWGTGQTPESRSCLSTTVLGSPSHSGHQELSVRGALGPERGGGWSKIPPGGRRSSESEGQGTQGRLRGRAGGGP